MPSFPYAHAVFIGRFQPFHHGHARMLDHALATAARCIVVLGSAHQAASPKNPFDWQTRADMIRRSLTPADASRVDFLPMRDYYDADRWAAAVREGVEAVADASPAGSSGAAGIALISHVKDASSDYLRWFPEWQTEAFPRQNDIDATPLRRTIFEAIMAGQSPSDAIAHVAHAVPIGTMDVLRAWADSPAAPALAHEYEVLAHERARWASAPYPPIFVTVDAVIMCRGRVLLVERDRAPGAGLLALPGGFLDPHEPVMAAALRELREETGLSLSPAEARTALRGVHIFDHPGRSQRGRVITHAHWFELEVTELPQVRGADDARSAEWVCIDTLAAREDRFFDDHFHILDTFLGVLPT